MCHTNKCRFEIGGTGFTAGSCGIFSETKSYFTKMYGFMPSCQRMDLVGFNKTVYEVLLNRIERFNDDVARQKNGVVNSAKVKANNSRY